MGCVLKHEDRTQAAGGGGGAPHRFRPVIQAARESYGYRVRNLLDVVSAQKTLAQARSEDIFARTQLLLQTADLAFETGDLIEVQPPKIGP